MSLVLGMVTVDGEPILAQGSYSWHREFAGTGTVDGEPILAQGPYAWHTVRRVCWHRGLVVPGTVSLTSRPDTQPCTCVPHCKVYICEATEYVTIF